MQALAVASQKSGSGKTTLAGYLAVEVEHQGAGRVLPARSRSSAVAQRRQRSGRGWRPSAALARLMAPPSPRPGNLFRLCTRLVPIGHPFVIGLP